MQKQWFGEGGVALGSDEGDWWHIAWATFLAWPPTDERGDWRELADLYARIRGAGGAVALPEPLPTRWQGRPPPTGHVALPATAADRLAGALRELAAVDRIAGGTPVASVAVAPVWVQMVLRCPATDLGQRVGRLKSRSATLLSFEPGRGRHLGPGVLAGGPAQRGGRRHGVGVRGGRWPRRTRRCSRRRGHNGFPRVIASAAPAAAELYRSAWVHNEKDASNLDRRDPEPCARWLRDPGSGL